MLRSRRELGAEAEDQAAQHLLSLGYTLITRRYSARGGELDVVALDGDVIVFVEVKARRDGRAPEESITPTKAARLRRAARAYLQEAGTPEHPHRFDVIAIDREGLRHHIGVSMDSAEMLEHVAEDRGGPVDDELDSDHRRQQREDFA